MFEAVDAAAAEFEAEYLPELLRQRAKREAEERERQGKEMARLMGDLTVGGGGGGGGKGGEAGMEGAAARGGGL